MSNQLPISPGLERVARSFAAAGGTIAIGGTKRIPGDSYYRMAMALRGPTPEVDVLKSRATGGTECKIIDEIVNWPPPSPIANGPEVAQ